MLKVTLMKFTFITIHPDLITAYQKFGAFKAATFNKSLAIDTINPRIYASDSHGSIDGRPYGGGDGMIMSAEPLARCIESLSPQHYVIYPSVRGKVFCQDDVPRLLNLPCPLAFVCGRFGGVDERFLDIMVDEELSLGNFVISGGELAALTIADALCRHLDGALGNQLSSQLDSLQQSLNGLIEPPAYTRPENFRGIPVPKVLLSGNHEKIAQWHEQQSVRVTKKFRPDLL